MEEEQDIQSDIVKQKQLRDAQENQEFDRDMDAYRRGKDLTDEQRKKVLQDNARKRQLLGSQLLDDIGDKFTEFGSSVMEASQEDPDTWTDDAIRIGLGGVKNVGTVLSAPGIKQGLQLLGAPAYYVGRGLGYGLEKAGVDPRYGHIAGEVGEWFIPGYGIVKGAKKLDSIGGAKGIYRRLLDQVNPSGAILATTGSGLEKYGNFTGRNATALKNYLEKAKEYRQSRRDLNLLKRSDPNYVTKRELMKGFVWRRDKRGVIRDDYGKEHILQRVGASKGVVGEWKLRPLESVLNQISRESGWDTGGKALKKLVKSINKDPKSADPFYHRLMEHGESAYLEHKVAQGMTWFWSEKAKNPTFAKWTSKSRNVEENLRILFNPNYKKLKDVVEGHLKRINHGFGEAKDKLVIDIEDPLSARKLKVPVAKRNNPGQILIRRAGTGEVVGKIGDYLSILYEPEFAIFFDNPTLRNNLLKQLDDFTGLPVVKPNETFLKWRSRFLRERINFIINEIPKQRVTRSKTGQKTAEAIIDSALKRDVEQFYLKWFSGVEQPAHIKKYLDLPPKIRMNTPLNKIL